MAQMTKAELIAKVERLVQALQEYADEKNYAYSEQLWVGPGPDAWSLARAALEETAPPSTHGESKRGEVAT